MIMRKTSFNSYPLVFFLTVVLLIPLYVHPQNSVPVSPTPATDTASKKQPLLDVLIELNKLKGAYFLYSQQALGKIQVNPFAPAPAASIEKLLGQVLKNTGLYYKKVDDRTFVILSRKPSATTGAGAYDPSAGIQDSSADLTALPENNISGHVLAADGRYLEGVNVTVKDSRKGTATDLSGAFSIPAAGADTLIFSFVGFKTRQIAAHDAGRIGVILQPSDQPLTEVMVTALGIKKQERTLGFSASELDGSRFTQSRDPNLGNALVGQVAGVSVAINATGPYGSSRVLIRGNASLSGNNQPLYVIDGVPYDNSTLGYAGQYGGIDLGDGLSNINPDDIEKVLVLKGVAASALYGYRGGNGAILITTKSGSRTHGIGVQVNNNFTLNSAIDERDYQYTYGQGVTGIKPTNQLMALAAPYYSWGAKMDGSPAVDYLGDTYAYKPAKNNFKNFFQTGLTNQSSVALTGANSRGHFRLGISDLQLNTVIPNSSMRQQGLNLNSTYFVTSRLQMDLTADYVFEHVNNRVSVSDNAGNVIAPVMYLANSIDIRRMKNHRTNPDGTEILPGTTDLYFENPYYIAYDYINTTDRNRITGGLTLKYNLLDWLYIEGAVARDGYIFNVTNITPFGVLYTRGDGVHGGNLTQYEINYHELNSNFMIGIHKNAGQSFTFSANLGGNQQDNITNISGIGMVPNTSGRPVGPFIVPGDYDASNILYKPYNAWYRHYRVNSLYANTDLGYKNYLFFNLTARNDWFSTLNINTDHYLYPSISGTFLFSDVWRLPSWISLGKVRASYAASSNGTEPYQNNLTYGLEGYSINNQPLGYISNDLLPIIPNASLRPVSISETETGFYLSFFRDRLGLDATYYNKLTTNDIVAITVSPTSGYFQYVENIGRIRNRGIELLLTGTPVKTPAFSWDLSFNFAYNKNKVLYIGKQSSIVIGGAIPRWGSEVSISNVVGMPYGQIMGYAYKRDTKGNIIYSDGVSNSTPAGEPEQTGVVPLGSTVYKQTGGLTNDFHYRDFTLSFLIDFKFGAKLYSGTNLLLYYYGLQKTTLQGRDNDYIGKGVLENGKANNIPVPAQQYFQDISAGGTDHIAEEFVYDASFIKLRSLSLGYTLPPAILSKRFIKGLSLSLVGRNLAMLMKHVPNIDPESSINNSNGQGLELTGYPSVRSWGFNINFKF